ncbi:hypothetical protein FD754_015995 [Muntiacus muntjak]|uniref:Cwf19-like protein C-terminal domain-containing protein n=1 Tax=Muntiacus muntjak TaxID=9888 RepID=A0A5N3VQ31_MUNMU|nr:hypothetical protein FD754_015995 [Muntiacus muntjak]
MEVSLLTVTEVSGTISGIAKGKEIQVISEVGSLGERKRSTAKANFEKEERRKELKRLRGEETWMLPDVIKRVEQISQEDCVKKKKKKGKHSKKVKKEKKKKSKKQKCEKNESSDSSSSSEDEWVEAVPSQTPGKEKAWKIKDEKLEKEDNQIIQRDEWMTVDFMSVKTVSSLSLKAEKEAARKTQQEKTQALEQSYQRMKEQAEKQNRNIEDIVAERYGSMEIFQLKLKEAEKAAFTKEDCRRERWKKPTYSDKAHSSQESGKSDLVNYNKSSRGRYNTTDIANNITKDKFSGDEKDGRSVFSETCKREPSPRKNQEFSSHVNLRAKFLRPSDDEEVSFHSKDRNFEPSSSSSAVVPQDSVYCGFRKPTENSEENLSWSRFGRGDRKHSNQKPLETSHSVDHGYISEDVREKSQEEGLRDDSVTKEHLQDTKSSLARYSDEDQEEVILVRTDHSGRVWPVNTPGKQEGRRKRQIVSTHEEKERVRYFHDDDNLSLNDLVKNEKMGTAENQNKLFMRMTSKFMGKADGDYYTLDGMFVSKAAEREHFGEEEENQRKKAIAEHRSLIAQMEKCLYCFDSSQFPKHLIVAIGVKMFRKSLVKMFEDKGLDCIFLETNVNMKKQYHMVYECIPLPKEVGDMAPIYFKVPRGLPYFSVNFGLQGGFAHVIEDQHKFPHYFGKEIIGGMLDIEPRVWRKGMRESFEDQRKKALQFAQWWKPFDFTGNKKC